MKPTGRAMFLLVLSAMIVTIGADAQFGEEENCDRSQLDDCMKAVPRTREGIPRTKEELDAHCLAYNTGMSCMDAWMHRCLHTDGQKYLQKQIGGARAVMRFLCANETSLRKDFLKEPQCWNRVSPYWAQCSTELHAAGREITERAQQLTYFNRNAELCCARDDFLICVADAGRVCSSTGSALLKRLAIVLAQDVAVCTQEYRAYCAAPSPHVATAPLLTAVSGIILYLPHI